MFFIFEIYIELAYREEKAMVEAEAIRVDEANKHRVQMEYELAMERPSSSHYEDSNTSPGAGDMGGVGGEGGHGIGAHRPVLSHGHSFESKFKKLNHQSNFTMSKEPDQLPPPLPTSSAGSSGISMRNTVSTAGNSLLHAAGSWHHMLPSHGSELKHHSSLKAVKEDQEFYPNHTLDNGSGALLKKRINSSSGPLSGMHDGGMVSEASPTPPPANQRRVIKRSNSHELPPSHPDNNVPFPSHPFHHSHSASGTTPTNSTSTLFYNNQSNAYKQDFMTTKFHLSKLPTIDSLNRRAKSPHILMHLQYLLHGQRAALFFAPTKTVQHTHEIWEVGLYKYSYYLYLFKLLFLF